MTSDSALASHAIEISLLDASAARACVRANTQRQHSSEGSLRNERDMADMTGGKRSAG
jgi:hypothetical protein